MNLIMNAVIKLSVIVMLLGSSGLKANDEVLHLCDEALTACEKQIKMYKDLSVANDETILRLIKQRNEAFEQMEHSYGAIPWYAWTVGGIALGLILGQTVVFK